jgi:hypothetical protein
MGRNQPLIKRQVVWAREEGVIVPRIVVEIPHSHKHSRRSESAACDNRTVTFGLDLLLIGMKSSKSPQLAVVIAILLAAAPVWAHHGSAGFDQKKPVHLIGKVSLLEWMNPHVVIHLDVADADGKLATWLVNTLPTNAATRQGFSKSSFAVGTDLIVDGYQAADGSNHVNGASIVFQNGKKIVTPGCFDASGRGLPWGSTQCFTPADRKGNRIE